MRQVLQNLRTGKVELADVPCPRARPGHLLIQTSRTLISAGTERMLVEFGRAGLIAKARSQPEKVRQVLDKIKTDGLLPTLETVFSRLDEPLPLGYCNTGRVVEVGRDVTRFAVGDRVASNGPHAEMVCVPVTLAARVPEAVDDVSASFTVLGAVALQGVRLLQPTFGERFVVTGLGLLGLIAVQILRSHGCNVLGVDINSARCELARRFGCATVNSGAGGDPLAAALEFTEGRGADGVLVTAATKSSEPMRQAAQMCRKRGRVVSTGNVGLELDRGTLYEKELSVQVSCSYGPGRYDPEYEERGRDYPLAYVRWTEARNFEALLNGLAQGWLDVHPLVSLEIDQADAASAYDAVVGDSNVLGVVLRYPAQAPPTQRVVRLRAAPAVHSTPQSPTVAMIGAGNFAKLVLLPALKATTAQLKTVASAGGVTSLHAARKFDADEAASDYREILADPEINAVFITTRHNSHAALVGDALAAGKHVFVEKPLAIDEDELAQVRRAHIAHPDRQIMVGFNRRFAPHAMKVKELLAGRAAPIAVEMMVNAGSIPADHWTRDPAVGGGRIIGEACHFVDLLMYLVGHPITSVRAAMFGGDRVQAEDKTTVLMTYADGSIGTLHYWANGPKSYPKERLEVFSEGRVVVIENWRRLRSFGWKGVPRMSIGLNKGHKAEIVSFINSVAQGGPPVIPFAELELVTRTCFAANQAAREGVTVWFSQEAGGTPEESAADVSQS
jgi:predicted dehydrogenase/threonine dehydrogenase-like Zn-dependent dehydrogenase